MLTEISKPVCSSLGVFSLKQAWLITIPSVLISISGFKGHIDFFAELSHSFQWKCLNSD